MAREVYTALGSDFSTFLFALPEDNRSGLWAKRPPNPEEQALAKELLFYKVPPPRG